MGRKRLKIYGVKTGMRQINISGLTSSAVQSRLKTIITLGVVPEVGFEISKAGLVADDLTARRSPDRNAKGRQQQRAVDMAVNDWPCQGECNLLALSEL